MKKFITLALMLVSLFGLTACKSSNNIDINNYLIEERNNLFVSSDDIYSLTLSSGLRENNYAYDGVVGEKVDFAILTFSRNDSNPLSNDTYTYLVVIDGENHTGFLTKSEIDNSYLADLEIPVASTATIEAEISFTGYTYKQNMSELSTTFTVDKNTALSIANKELNDSLKTMSKDKNIGIEAVMKILKDYSTSEVKNYYWYVGAVSTDGCTIGVLIDANSGDILAKKV